MKIEKQFFVYIIKCIDHSYYIGVTNNIETRLYIHNEGLNTKCYTYSRRPVRLEYLEIYDNPNEAIFREKQLKGWSRRKKFALIKDNKQNLIKYSQRKNA